MNPVTNTEKQNSIEMSCIRFCVLAGITGFRNVYGIECQDIVRKIHAQYDSVIRTAVEEMVSERVLSYGMDGMFHVHPSLLEMIRIVCSPDAIFSFCRCGKEERRFTLLEKDGGIIQAEFLRRKERVRFTYRKRLSAKDLLGSMKFTPGGFQAEIYSSDLAFANKCIKDFNEEEAKKHLQKCIADDTICHAMMELLRQPECYVSASAQYRSAYGYRDAGGFYLTDCAAGTMLAETDTHSYIRFLPVTREEAISALDALLLLLHKEHTEESFGYTKRGEYG